jgi:hypothetical protein
LGRASESVELREIIVEINDLRPFHHFRQGSFLVRLTWTECDLHNPITGQFDGTAMPKLNVLFFW